MNPENRCSEIDRNVIASSGALYSLGLPIVTQVKDTGLWVLSPQSFSAE